MKSVAGSRAGSAGAATAGAARTLEFLQRLGGMRDTGFGVAWLLCLPRLFDVLFVLALGRLSKGGHIGGHVVVDFLQIGLAEIRVGEGDRAGEQCGCGT